MKDDNVYFNGRKMKNIASYSVLEGWIKKYQYLEGKLRLSGESISKYSAYNKYGTEKLFGKVEVV